MQTKIEESAKSYQKLDKQIKDLQTKQKQFKELLVRYAKEHKSEFDENFQLKFANGTYIIHRFKDVMEYNKDSKSKLIKELDPEFIQIELCEKEIIEESFKDARLRKLFAKLDIKISKKETFAIYAK